MLSIVVAVSSALIANMQLAWADNEVSDYATAKGVQDGRPVNKISDFSVEDVAAYAWINFTNIYPPSHTVLWKWYTPGGSLYHTESVTIQNPQDSGYDYWAWYAVWGSISIQGYSPSLLPGEWKVEVYLDGAQSLIARFKINDIERLFIQPSYGFSWPSRILNVLIDQGGPEYARENVRAALRIWNGAQEWFIYNHLEGVSTRYTLIETDESQADLISVKFNATQTNDEYLGIAHTFWQFDASGNFTRANSTVSLSLAYKNGVKLNDNALMSLAVHELGHSLGLGHTLQAGDVMNAKGAYSYELHYPSTLNLYAVSQLSHGVNRNTAPESYTLLGTTPYHKAAFTRAASSIQLYLSKNTVGTTDPVTLTVTTSPSSSKGVVTLQYRKDGGSWTDIASGTPSSGAFQYIWKPTATGTYRVRAIWSGDVNYETAVSTTSVLVVTKAKSSIELSLSKNTVAVMKSVTLTVTVLPSISQGTVTIEYSKDGGPWTKIANGAPTSGVFTYIWAPTAKGTYTIIARWSEDGEYELSISSAKTLDVVLTLTRMEIKGPTNAKLDETITLTATLLDSQGDPIGGATITFRLGSAIVRTTVTDSSGKASVTYRLTVMAGTYTVIASYSGSQTYTDAIGESTLVVQPWKLTVSGNAPQVTLISFSGLNFTTDVSGKVAILVNSTGTYTLKVNTPLSVSAGKRLVFVKWGDESASVSRFVVMDADRSLYVSTKLQYYLTLISHYGAPRDSGWYDSGSTVEFSIESSVDYGNKTRRVFTGWLQDGSLLSGSVRASIVLTKTTTLVADWKKQYYFSVTSQYGKPSGEGWHDVGATVTGSVQSPFLGINGTRYLASGFTGRGVAPSSGKSTTVTFTLGAPSDVAFLWKTQYYLWVASTYGSPEGEGWYDALSNVTFSVPRESSGGEGVRYVFKAWEGKGAGSYSGPSNLASVTITGPIVEKAVWLVQFYTKVASQYGKAAGEGWYDAGSKANISVSSPVEAGPETRYVVVDYEGSGSVRSGEGSSVTFVITSPSSVIWKWRTQYLLTISSEHGDPRGAGWHEAGLTTEFSVSSPWPVRSGERYVVVGYRGGVTGEGSTSTIVMESPKTVVFNWKKQYLLRVGNGGHGSVSGTGWYDAGSSATISVTGSPESGGEGVKYVFDRWVGAGSSSVQPSDQVLKLAVSSPVNQTATWRTQFLVSFGFKDNDGKTSIRPSSLEIKDSRGERIELSAYERIWLDRGRLEITSVKLAGVNVAPPNYSTNLESSGTVGINLRAYWAKIVVRDAAGLPVTGATVDVMFPNGMSVAVLTDSNGEANLGLIPFEKYVATVSFLGQTARIEGDASTAGETTLQLPIGSYMLAILAVPSAIVVATVFLVRRRKTAKLT